MKKLLILSFLFTIFLLPGLVEASTGAGACSRHDGVNCLAGADDDGSVICNDGDRNSSVLYVNMDLCHPCEAGLIQNEYNLCVEDWRVQRPTYIYEKAYFLENLPNRINFVGKVIYTDRPTELPVGYMIKAHSDPKCYAVMENGELRWVKTEAVAKRMFGDNWDNDIVWLEEALVYTYRFGEDIGE